MNNLQNVVKIIEEQKEDRTKCIFFFKLTLTNQQKIYFKKSLKNLINEINNSEK